MHFIFSFKPGPISAFHTCMTLNQVLIHMFYALESNDLQTYARLREIAISRLSEMDEEICENIH